MTYELAEPINPFSVVTCNVGHHLIPHCLESGIRQTSQILARAHDRGVKVVLATIMPFGGSFSHYTPAKDQLRQDVNYWIRTSGEADAVIDFDEIARDPEKPSFMRKDFGGDGLHPGEAGYRMMGDAIDLSIFK